MAVVPRRMVEEKIASGAVSELFVKGLRFERTYKIIRHREKKLTKAAEAFVGLCLRDRAEGEDHADS